MVLKEVVEQGYYAISPLANVVSLVNEVIHLKVLKFYLKSIIDSTSVVMDLF